MKRLLSITCAVVAVATACGFAATTASALSLGPAGTKITGTGYIDGKGLGVPDLYFSGLQVSCRPVTLSGTLNGSASVTVPHTFSDCQATKGTTGTATVTAPGGLTLSLVKYDEKQANGAIRGDGQLSSGPGGIIVTVGNCTLTLGPNLDLLPSSPHDGQMFLVEGTDGFTSAALLNNTSGAAYAKYPYTGSSGCPTAQRGTHTSGAGTGFYYMKIAGLTLTP